jgi:hypothetical protein
VSLVVEEVVEVFIVEKFGKVKLPKEVIPEFNFEEGVSVLKEDG